MKFLTLIAILSLALPVYADEQPAYLKEAVITVTLKDGKEYKFSANDFKVVPRNGSNEEEVRVLHAMVASQAASLADSQQKMNRVRVLGGVAPSGLETSTVGTTTSVKNKSEGVLGVGYDRMISKKWSVGGTALNNGTYLLDVGLDF